jgi:serine/alanine racemase
MDMFMVDVTNLSHVVDGDIATIFGRDGDAFLPAGEVAAAAGTICHELLTGVGQVRK